MLTVKKTKPESTETITCTSEASQLDFSSSDDCGKTEGYKWWVTATQGKIEVAITHTLAETVVFRCDVTIDEDASDSKLVTSEALGILILSFSTYDSSFSRYVFLLSCIFYLISFLNTEDSILDACTFDNSINP